MTRRSAKASNKEVSTRHSTHSTHSTKTKHEHERQHERVRSSSTEASKKFELKNSTQRDIVRSIESNYLTILCGSAGSGKTLMAIYSAYRMLKSPESNIEKIIVIRLAEQIFNENIGALPGEKDEKLLHLLAPLLDNMALFMTPGEIKMLCDKGQIEVLPISHCRGRSFINCAIIVEEAQNMNYEMVMTALTRLGEGSSMTITGDHLQTDIKGRQGMKDAMYATENLDGVKIFKLSSVDIQRHPLVQQIIKRIEERKGREEREEPKLR